jgi:hypothetical protein
MPGAGTPGPVGPVPPDPGVTDPAPPRAGERVRSTPAPRAWRAPAADRGRSVRVQELADRLAAELVGRQGRPADGSVEGLLVVPLQREADVAALLTVVRVDARCASPDRPGRHRGEESGDEDRDDRERGEDDDERDRDEDDGDDEDRNEDEDEDDRDQDDDGSTASTRVAGHPAMAVFVTSGDDPSGRIQARHIDSGAMLSALGDLQSDAPRDHGGIDVRSA